jgi:hypothetical protein
MHFKQLLPLLVLILVSCGKEADERIPSGLEKPLWSSSNQFYATFPIQKNETVNYPVWSPHIYNQNRKIEYIDEKSDLSGYHMSYFEWSPENILWLYNSDSGKVYFYQKFDGAWSKKLYLPKQAKFHPTGEIGKKFKTSLYWQYDEEEAQKSN